MAGHSALKRLAADLADRLQLAEERILRLEEHLTRGAERDVSRETASDVSRETALAKKAAPASKRRGE